jgi:hypothetical protein
MPLIKLSLGCAGSFDLAGEILEPSRDTPLIVSKPQGFASVQYPKRRDATTNLPVDGAAEGPVCRQPDDCQRGSRVSYRAWLLDDTSRPKSKRCLRMSTGCTAT